MADYSINAVTRRVVYSGSAGLGPYAFSFEILEQTDITVYFNATKLTLTTDYTVSINANGTGSVTLIVATNVPQTPVTADQIVVVGARDLERVTDFVTAGDLRASALNEQLDSLVIFDQQVAEEAKRTMRAPVYDPALVEDGGSLNMELPTASSRAGKTLAFDDNGNPIVGEDIGNWRGDWAAGTAYTVRDIVRDASNYNIYRVNTSHTSSGTTPISTNADVAKWDLVIDASYAATQAANAAASATAAAASAIAAATSETNAATSETNAASSASTATTKASEAATSATNAATSETNAGTSETNAATSATNASNSASAASTSASAASTSATAAASSATAAATSETNAGTSETNAASSASAAATSATNAATSATNSSSSATAAATSATNAATSATNAATSATAASSSATAAANSAAAAAAAFDNFDDTYLGSFTADPTVDNDGDALVEGALYFNTTANEMRVYDGANWIAASSAGTASLLEYKYTATAGQTTFSGTDDNSATLSYSTANLIVTLNGIVLENGTDYTATSGTSIVLTVGAAAGDELNVIAFKSFTTADMVSATTGGTFNGNVAVNGNLGIGTTSPSNLIHTSSGSETVFHYGEKTSGSTAGIAMADTVGSTQILSTDGNMRFKVGGNASTAGTSSSEAMRIDNTGNMLVGKTSSNTSTAGVEARSNGQLVATLDGGTALIVNRKTSDGDVVKIMKDGTTVASIGVNSNDNITFSATTGGGAGLEFFGASGTKPTILPMKENTTTDDAVDLGRGGTRFDNIFATNGTIQTSDQNEKQQIASLTDAEITAAKAISTLFKTFKWNDKVEAKGDAARTHTGVIAQDVEQAMTDAGLDAADYAFWCSDTWWEADESYTDDDGNTQTRTNIYDTQADAPAGAIERTRLGIRYPELLSFIGAATEQRLADIETRLTALEANNE